MTKGIVPGMYHRSPKGKPSHPTHCRARLFTSRIFFAHKIVSALHSAWNPDSILVYALGLKRPKLPKLEHTYTARHHLQRNGGEEGDDGAGAYPKCEIPGTLEHGTMR